MMNFGMVVTQLTNGKFMAREAWPGLTYIYLDGEVIMYSHLGRDYVWTPAHADLLASDWNEIIPTR